MAAKIYAIPPAVGTVVTFRSAASQLLAGIPGRVSYIIGRLTNGDYLVTLEYDQPVKLGSERVRRIDALTSQLELLGQG
ncbi:hypothetical protein [Kallotenue papyrolyticum]|uniref:hypothetical protein n=1 Tax=Kallotenue papyrolyticum TaxID=1325125 RepID=UPI0004925E83|nr:hypothetical protein [Kallotenue papyrolyticum]